MIRPHFSHTSFWRSLFPSRSIFGLLLTTTLQGGGLHEFNFGLECNLPSFHHSPKCNPFDHWRAHPYGWCAHYKKRFIPKMNIIAEVSSVFRIISLAFVASKLRQVSSTISPLALTMLSPQLSQYSEISRDLAFFSQRSICPSLLDFFLHE